MRKKELNKVNSVAKGQVAKVKKGLKDMDYKTLARNALLIAAPIVVMSVLVKKHKTSAWEKSIEPLFKDLKKRLKKF